MLYSKTLLLLLRFDTDYRVGTSFVVWLSLRVDCKGRVNSVVLILI